MRARAALLNIPGIAISAAIAAAALAIEPWLKAVSGGFGLPAMVIALCIGIALHPLAANARLQPGINWCVRKLLRIAIALLGLRIALGDILALGAGTLATIVVSMSMTILAAIWLARLLGRDIGYGALAGAANAVCGASAVLATTTVVPNYRNKDADTVFSVVMANGLSTLVMLVYPPVCLWLGLSIQETGVLLGGTIHDVAQVAGAGYAVSEQAGNTAVVVKLVRVFLLLPVVMIIGWWFARRGDAAGAAEVPTPVFAIVFLVLVLVNTLAGHFPDALPYYLPLKSMLGTLSSWGLLLSIAALGLGTSISAIMAVGWRHVAVFTGATLVIFVAVLTGVLIGR